MAISLEDGEVSPLLTGSNQPRMPLKQLNPILRPFNMVLCAINFLCWCFVFPVGAAVLFFVLRPAHKLLAICGVSTSSLPTWLETPWDMLTAWGGIWYGFTIVDADGPAASTLIPPGMLEKRGAVLANHRSFGDFFVDPLQAHRRPNP